MCPIFSFFVDFFHFLHVRCHWCGGNVEEKAHSKNVVFDLKDLRLFSLCMVFYIYSSVLII